MTQNASGTGISTEFEMPTKAKVPGRLWGETEVDATIKVRVLENGDIQFWQIVPGKEPERVTPTPGELAYVKELIDSRQKAAAPEKATPAPTDKLEPVKDPNTGAAVGLRDPNTGTIKDLPNPPAAKAPAAVVTRSTGRTEVGPEGQEMPGRETVTETQADYDLKVGQERRLAQQAALQQAQQAEATAIAKARLQVEQGQLSAQQARDQVNAELEKIRLSLSAESNALTRRSQDITVRGQDISAGVSQRGQDMDYEGRMAQSGTSLASALLPYWNAPGQVQSTNSLMAGGPPVPTQPSAPPFTPDLPLQIAQQARAQMPSQYQLPGAPGQVAAPSYRLPG